MQRPRCTRCGGNLFRELLPGAGDIVCLQCGRRLFIPAVAHSSKKTHMSAIYDLQRPKPGDFRMERRPRPLFTSSQRAV